MATVLPGVARIDRQPVPPVVRKSNENVSTRLRAECMGKKERELHERRLGLRAQLPDLNYTETERFNNSYKKNLCIDILQQGFHKSFAEIFSLVKQQEENRLKAGPDSELWYKKLLRDEHEKLRQLEVHTVSAEKALLQDDYLTAYKEYHTLAEYFTTEGDDWLADHFFNNCLRLGESISQLDEGKTAADGHCNVGLCLQLAGKYDQALRHFELFYQLTKNRSDWITDDGEMLLHSKSCHCLTRIYTIVADRQTEQETSLQYLQRAYDMSMEGGNRKICCEAGYRLGLSLLKSGDSRTALTYLESYLDYCKSVNDKPGIGKACEALSKVHDMQGNVEMSIKYLKNYIDVSEDHGDDKTSINAYNRLGIRYNTQGRYGQAVEYFGKSYNLARLQSDARLINTSRVLSGIAHAHNSMYNYKRHAESEEREYLSRLMEWKNTRADDYDKIDDIKLPAENTEENQSAEKTTADLTEAKEEENLVKEEEQEERKENTEQERNKEQEPITTEDIDSTAAHD